MKDCDFCADPIADDDAQAVVYPATDIVDDQIKVAYIGNWLACETCASFIRQYDSGRDKDAKENLARRSLEKYRRRYGLRVTPSDDKSVNSVLLTEIKMLHEKFWLHRQGEPVSYTSKLLESGS